jgi:arabinose-5-phosphate isomerase
MSAQRQASSSYIQPTTFEIMRSATELMQAEAQAILRISQQLPLGFAEAVQQLQACRGCVVVTGIGKAGWVGQKISASLASTGTRSHFLHPAEAIHGDLGRIAADDWILALSNSGETDELTRILPHLKRLSAGLVAITAGATSTLAQAADIVIAYGKQPEACHLGLAPSTSTSVMLALGDALALVLSRLKKFEPLDFARYHPGGSLGRKLATVDEIMRGIDKCRVAREHELVREIYVRSSVTERRIGVILVVDEHGKLSGLFTDSDLARLLERRRDGLLDRPINEVMTRRPLTVTSGASAQIAVDCLAAHNISELPVVNSCGEPQGVIDITDVIGMLPTV